MSRWNDDLRKCRLAELMVTDMVMRAVNEAARMGWVTHASCNNRLSAPLPQQPSHSGRRLMITPIASKAALLGKDGHCHSLATSAEWLSQPQVWNNPV